MGSKVRVTKIVGGGADMGLMDPKVNMVTHEGTISAIASDGNTVTIGTGAAARTQYPEFLFVNHDHATGVWSYPSGDGSIPFGRDTGLTENGLPAIISSGFAFMTGSSVPFTFGR